MYIVISDISEAISGILLVFYTIRTSLTQTFILNKDAHGTLNLHVMCKSRVKACYTRKKL